MTRAVHLAVFKQVTYYYYKTRRAVRLVDAR